jgi:predicted lipoprotein
VKPLVALAALLLASAPALAAPDYGAINDDAARRHVAPRYKDFTEATATLEGEATRFCAGPRDAPAALQDAWRGAMAAWQGVQHLRFGPIEWFNRFQRVAFWPDPRNVTARQLAELFAKQDAAALEADRLVQASVAVQGLSAIERVLFERAEIDKLKAEPFRCAWLEAATRQLATTGRETLAAWSDRNGVFLANYLAPGNAPTGYRAASEATLDLFKSLYTAVELVADHKLARPLGDKGNARPLLAESWRSEISLANIKANLEAARDLYASLRASVADAALAQDLARRFDASLAAIAPIGPSLEKAVADPARRPAVEKLRRETAALKRVLADRLAEALGLPLGFNALDGD